MSRNQKFIFNGNVMYSMKHRLTLRERKGYEKTILIMVLTLCGAAVFAQNVQKKKFALIIYNANYNEDRSLNYPLKDEGMSDTVEKLKADLENNKWKLWISFRTVRVKR